MQKAAARRSNVKSYLIDITIRVQAEDQEEAWFLANSQAGRAFNGALVNVSEPFAEETGDTTEQNMLADDGYNAGEDDEDTGPHEWELE